MSLNPKWGRGSGPWPIYFSRDFVWSGAGFHFGPRDRAISARQSSYSDAEPTDWLTVDEFNEVIRIE